MASSYPTSQDSFARPTSGVDTQDSPNAATLANDHSEAVEALEAKVGLGSSPASGASSKQVLQADGAGSSAWATVAANDLSDVDTNTATPAVGDALVWDGSNWVPDSGTYAAVVAVGDDIQAAIDALPATGGIIRLAAGTHTLTAGLTVPSNTALVGSGQGATILKVSNGANVTAITNSDTISGNEHIVVRDLTIDGNLANQDGDDQEFGIHFQRVTNLTVENVETHDVDGQGIQVTGEGTITQVTKVHNVYTHDNGTDGLRIEHSSRKVSVSNVVARDNGRHGVVCDHSEGLYTNIHSDGNAGYGIFVRNVFACTLANLSATRNTQHGIYADSMVASSGTGWRAQNNGTAATTWDDLHFAGNDLGYGVTHDTVISGVWAGYHVRVEAGAGIAERYALYVDPAISDDLELKDVHLGSAATAAYSGPFPLEKVEVGPTALQNFQSPSLAIAALSNTKVWPMDPSSVEYLWGEVDLPSSWNEYDVEVVWANAGAGAGDVAWRFDTAGVGDTDSLNGSFTNGSVVTDAAGSQHVAQSVTVASGLTAPPEGDAVAFRLLRNATHASDTLAADAEVFRLRFFRTA